MPRPLALVGLLAFLLTLDPSSAPAADEPAAARSEDASLRQLLHESLREIKGMEDDEAGFADLVDELMPGHGGNRSKVSAMRAIGAALASVGDRESARETW